MSDDLAAARGCLYGAITGVALWAALIAGIAGGIAIYLGLWQVMP